MLKPLIFAALTVSSIACHGLIGQASATGLLQTSGTTIVDAAGKSVHLAGFNLGGWFVMESFMSPMDSGHQLNDSWSVMNTLASRFGETTERQLITTYQTSWITDNDIANIADAGFNLVRIPLWWGQFFALNDQTPSGWRSADAFTQLDAIIQSCANHGVYAILDMHGVIGGQSTASNTGRASQNTYWTDTTAQQNTAWMWQQIAAHYKGNTTIAGYDLINEPAPPSSMPLKATVLAAYDQLYSAVRDVDPGHIIFVEATFGSWTLSMLPSPKDHGWSNVAYELHAYNWPKSGQTSDEIASAVEAGSDKVVTDVQNHASWNVPTYVGEFNDFSADASVWKYSISDYNAAGLSWSVWSYKAVNGVAPNYWGYYDPWHWPTRPNPATDTKTAIGQYWTNWSTISAFSLNTALGF
ncbi:MAG: glycoside hydrolase family 5 protein [Janthinobacterium lividum]